MGITLELAALDEDTLDNLDDDSTDAQIASALFEESEHTCTAGRIWHVIHYLLTRDARGNAKPESFIVSGGREVGPAGAYGCARVFGPEECQAIAGALIDEKTFAKRLADWPLPDDVVYRSHVKLGKPEPDYIEIYVELKTFIEAAAARDEGILVCVVG